MCLPLLLVDDGIDFPRLSRHARRASSQLRYVAVREAFLGNTNLKMLERVLLQKGSSG